MNILIAAHYNLNNGDRALLEATVRIFNRNEMVNHITVSAYRPELLNDSRFDTVGWPLRNGKYEKLMLKLSEHSLFRVLFKIFFRIVCDAKYIKALKNADIVFISGGHHLTDILSKKSYYKLSCNFIVPIIMKKKVILLPQSIGPVKDEKVKKSVKFILEKVYSIAYRDKESGILVDSIIKHNRVSYVPDLVYSLSPNKHCELDDDIVGIALYHSYDGDNRNEVLNFTMSNLAQIIDDLLERGYIVKIIPMDEEDEMYAGSIISNVQSSMKNDRCYVAQRRENVLDVIEEFNGLKFALAYKTHATIFSIICNTPLVAIAYHSKTIDFMNQIGLGEYVIFDNDASYKNVISLIDKMLSNIEFLLEKEKQGVINNRKIINDYITGMMK